MYNVKLIYKEFELDTKMPIIPKIGDRLDFFLNEELFLGIVTKRIFDFNLSGSYESVWICLKDESISEGVK